MSDRFHPLSMEQLTSWVFTELEQKGALFNVPRSAFFVPRLDDRFRTPAYGVELETPFGVAAGPHTQMAQNIITVWLVGARLIELKTIQTLDELDVNKPCIDVVDEGYNVEWSQELKVHQSFDEYLRAWVLIHALHRKLGWPGERPGMVFNMSVGYNLEGMLRPNVQWYFDAMADASAYLPAYVEIVARHYPAVREIEIPTRLSDTITLSTMHGCPPEEIEKISLYLLEERGLHTSVKCNPTLLGAERVRGIVNDDLGFADVPIPDAAFGHDLKWADAVPMFHNLRRAAASRGLAFGLKLSNTLEVDNWRGAFDRDPTMYLSGRPLHAVTTNLAAAIAEEFAGEVPLSFAGGADCFNVADLLGAGMRTVTVCSDLLKSGGYLRLLQYTENVDAAFDAAGALDTADFIRRTALASGFEGDGADVTACARFNLRAYADEVRRDWRYLKSSFRTDRSKTLRVLGAFDCIAAPCLDECPVDQQVPRYMAAVRAGDFREAVRITRLDNPLPAVLGRVCDHLCENTCIRTHLDQPLAIRQIKRFIMEQEVG
jgi:putative selenate reductase